MVAIANSVETSERRLRSAHVRLRDAIRECREEMRRARETSAGLAEMREQRSNAWASREGMVRR